MTFKILYWDEVTRTAQERDATPQEVADHIGVAPTKSVPRVVTRRQALQALYLAGKLAEVEPIINTFPSPQKELALIEWQAAVDFDRNWPLVNQLGPLLNLTPDDIDDLFIEASKL